MTERREIEQILERLHRAEYGSILASLVRYSGDIEDAEEQLGDAFAAALEQWPGSGIPERPGAWLFEVARRRAIDRTRRSRVYARKLERLQADYDEAAPGEDESVFPHPDDQLRLVFTCCHPALPRESRVPLTLNTLCGLTAAEVGRAFLVQESTMAQRIVRAKRKIREAGIPYRVPHGELLRERLPSVLLVVYLVFNEGYAATRGDRLVRSDLCAEGLRLARLLEELIPGEPEVEGLLALLLLQHSRQAARVGAGGNLLRLEDQDRSLWDPGAILEGSELLERALARGRVGIYQMQAAIAALHAQAPSVAETDWRQVLGIYQELHAIFPSPVVALNRAVAASYAHGPEEGLRLVEELAASGELGRYQYLHATRGELLLRLGRHSEAAEAFGHAASLSDNERERAWLEERRRSIGDA